MIKKSIILLTVILYFSSIGSYSVIYLGYLLNKNYFASELCVQKEVKNNCCQGSCKVKNEFKKETEKKTNKSAIIKVDDKVEYTFTLNRELQTQFYSFQKFYSKALNNFLSNYLHPEIPPPKC